MPQTELMGPRPRPAAAADSRRDRIQEALAMLTAAIRGRPRAEGISSLPSSTAEAHATEALDRCAALEGTVRALVLALDGQSIPVAAVLPAQETIQPKASRVEEYISDRWGEEGIRGTTERDSSERLKQKWQPRATPERATYARPDQDAAVESEAAIVSAEVTRPQNPARESEAVPGLSRRRRWHGRRSQPTRAAF